MEPHPYRTAFENGDHAALVDLLADDVVFHSPVISEPGFQGRDSVSALLRLALERIETVSFTHELEQDGARAFVVEARAAGKPFKGVNLIETDKAGKIREIWVFARPLTGVVAIAEAIGTGLGGLVGPPGPGPVGALTRPLAAMAAATDRLGGRLIGRLNRRGDGGGT